MISPYDPKKPEELERLEAWVQAQKRRAEDAVQLHLNFEAEGKDDESQ